MVIPYFLLAIAVIIGGAILGRWFLRASPGQIVTVLRWLAIFIGALGALYLVTAGRHLLALLTIPLLIFLLRSRGIWNRIKAAAGPKRGQSSAVETRFLRMVLDHDSGAMEGTVLEGRFEGWRLSDMSIDNQIDLWRECLLHDEQSAALLEAYLDRNHGEAWREAAGVATGGANSGEGGPSAGGGGRMSAVEAYRILGLEEGASEGAIRDAHRRLMQKMHPDHGGSNYIASKINEAKAVLLGE